MCVKSPYRESGEPRSSFPFQTSNVYAVTLRQDLGTTALEPAKRMTQWSSFYFTHSTSYYPVPSTQIHLQVFPRITQQNLPVMSSADQDLMRNWANTHGKCVRQRTVRQETTKYKAGTLPLNMYHNCCLPGRTTRVCTSGKSRTT